MAEKKRAPETPVPGGRPRRDGIAADVGSLFAATPSATRRPSPPDHQRHRHVAVAAAVALVVILVIAVAVSLAQPSEQPAPVALPIGAWTPVGPTGIEPGSTSGSFRLRFDQQYWGGALADSAVGCDYLVSGSGRIVQGKGYGFAVRANLSSGTPEAQAFQYDSGLGGYRITQYPTDGGVFLAAATDSSWHQFSMSVKGDEYVVRIDDEVVTTGFTTLSCGDIYLRVWNGGVAEFRDLTVTPI